MTIQSTIQAFAAQGMPDRAIVARMGLSLPHVRSARCRGAEYRFRGSAKEGAMTRYIVETAMAVAFVALLVAYGVNWPAPEPAIEASEPAKKRPSIWWQR